MRWKHGITTVYNIGYHIIWTPKYRRKILVNGIDIRLKELLDEKAKELNVSIENMEVMPDHIHLFVKTNPSSCPQWIVNQFKGYTSRKLRQEFPSLVKKLPCLWTRSYYIESVGHISEETIKKYIEDQKNK
jgi:putative transposase